MRPAELTEKDFATYPPQARQVAIEHLTLFRELPLTFLPLLLHELIAYDWRFPAERRQIESQLAYLSSSTRQTAALAAFAQVRLAPALEKSDWVNQPGAFSEKLSEHLWATHQMDSFREAATQYAQTWRAAMPEKPPATPRLGMVVIGKGVAQTDYQLFGKLRPHGVYFTAIKPQNGLRALLDAVAARARFSPAPYAHWYVDGGEAQQVAVRNIAQTSWQGLAPVRQALLARMRKEIASGAAGPEGLRSLLARMQPGDLGMQSEGDAGVMSRFEISLLTEGSGTQIFATTFAQWAAREALRRAQPETLLVRYQPRQRQQPMNELLSGVHSDQLDPEGSLVDADMGAYYTWINQQRLVGAEHAAFLAWFEGHSEAVAIGPTLPRGSVSSQPATMEQVLRWVS